MQRLLLIICMLGGLSACQTHRPLKTIDYLDVNRFMGDWYVIAAIQTPLEKGAHNALESYALNSDGSIATTFTFRQDGFDGDLKRYTPTGFIEDTQTNARWSMQFIWPIKVDYRVVYLSEDYETTIIGRQARDYVWMMARRPNISESQFNELVTLIADLDYDIRQLKRIPQKWDQQKETD